MENLYVRLEKQKLVFKDDFPRETILIKEWNFNIERIEQKEIEDFRLNITSLFTGWHSSEVEKNKSSTLITFSPIFFVETLTEDIAKEDNIIVNEAEKSIEKLLEKITSSQKNEVNPNEVIKYSKDMDLYKFEEIGCSYSEDFENLKRFLVDNQIDFYVEKEYSRSDEVGAGSGIVEVFIFVSEAVSAGIIYDLIKNGVSLKRVGITKDRSEKIEVLAANHLKTQPANLIVADYGVNGEDQVHVKYKYNYKIHSFVFDSKNQITNYRIVKG